MNEKEAYVNRYIGAATQANCVPRVEKPETIGTKIGELNANLSELANQSRVLANSLAGCEPEDPRCEPPSGSDVGSQLDCLRRLSREINRNLVRANQAVGN